MKAFHLWLGEPGHLREEVAALLRVLREPLGDCLHLYAGPQEGAGWICDPWVGTPTAETGTITLYTSGTTGTPKAVRKRWAEVLAAPGGRGGPEDHWLLAYSPARWAGLSVLAHCLRRGCQLVVPRSLAVEDLLAALPQATHLSLTPSLFRKLLVQGEPATDRVRQVTFGGEAATQRVLDDAKRAWPRARISHMYASSELGDLACASDGQEGFPRLPGTLTDEGELVVEGVATGDLWRREGDRFLFTGRRSDLINVGGAKVSPAEVEALLGACEGVAECRVFGVSSPLVGQLVAAEYTGTADPAAIAQELRRILPRYAVPRLQRVASLSLTDAGKVSRR